MSIQMKSYLPVLLKRSGAQALKKPFSPTGVILTTMVKLLTLILCSTSLDIWVPLFYWQKITLAAAHHANMPPGQYEIMAFAASARRVLLISSTITALTTAFCL